MSLNTVLFNVGDQASKVAKALLDEHSENQFQVHETPLVTMAELILAFTNLGCTVEIQKKPRSLLVRRRH
jgi:hypothetical protein